MRAYLFPPAGSISYVAANTDVSLAAIVNASLLRFVFQLLTAGDSAVDRFTHCFDSHRSWINIFISSSQLRGNWQKP